MSGIKNFVGRIMASNWVIYVCLVVMFASGVDAGWNVGRAPLQVQLSKLTTDHATEKMQQAEHALATLRAAQARGDALSAGLYQQQTQIDQLKTEARRAVTQVTTGKPCLNAAALRLLNSAPGIDVQSLPPATSSPTAAGESPGTAGGDGAEYSSDTDLALWVIDAGSAFEVCRTRLDALIDWHTH